jgi:hypothetical protein
MRGGGNTPLNYLYPASTNLKSNPLDAISVCPLLKWDSEEVFIIDNLVGPAHPHYNAQVKSINDHLLCLLGL